jgi:hypothetical protein
VESYVNSVIGSEYYVTSMLDSDEIRADERNVVNLYLLRKKSEAKSKIRPLNHEEGTGLEITQNAIEAS